MRDDVYKTEMMKREIELRDEQIKTLKKQRESYGVTIKALQELLELLKGYVK